MSDVGDAVPELLKPRMRGRLHQWASFVSVVLGVGLVLLAPSGAARAAATVYAVTVVSLFTTSALYHRRTWSAAARRRMQRLDHSMIFLLIAGTYTPLTVLVLPRPQSILVLCLVWGGALVGAGMKLLWRSGPTWTVFLVSSALGLGSVIVLPHVLHNAGVLSLVLLLVGGVVYLVGMLILLLRRPDPLPTVFGYHEVFHALTLVAGAVFFVLNTLVVVRA